MPPSTDAFEAAGGRESIPTIFRKRRMAVFRRLTRNFPRPIRVLDIGGTQSFWETNDAVEPEVFQVTLYNLAANTKPSTRDNFEARVGDATDLSSMNRAEFDLVHSNSVIEHLFNWDNQKRMAEQILSLDLPFWIQTPNYWFPMEPHYRILGLQWMPRKTRIRLLHLKRCGLGASPAAWKRSVELVEEIRLLKVREMRRLFPRAEIFREQFGPLTKSVIAHQGIDRFDKR